MIVSARPVNNVDGKSILKKETGRYRRKGNISRQYSKEVLCMKKRKMLIAGVVAACIMSVFSPVSAQAKVKLSQKKAEVMVADKVKLKVTGTGKKVKWTSANPSIAKVSASGNVKGVRKGITTVTAKVGGKRLTCKVSVINRYYRGTGLEVNATKVSMSPGASFRVKVKNTILSPTQFKWTSSNPKKCKVTKKGVIKPKRDGAYIITVKTKDGKRKAKIRVTVKNGLPTTSNAVSDATLRFVGLRVAPRIESVTQGHVFFPGEFTVVATRSDNVQISPKDFVIRAQKTNDGRYLVTVFYGGLSAETYVRITG